MLTIFSEIIKVLIVTRDEGCQHLALALVDDKKDFYRWWALPKSTADKIGLPMYYISTVGGSSLSKWVAHCYHCEWESTKDCEDYLITKYKSLGGVYVDNLE